jgi:hypothetical protein
MQAEILTRFDMLLLLVHALALLSHLHPMGRQFDQRRLGVRIPHLACECEVLLSFAPICLGIHLSLS